MILWTIQTEEVYETIQKTGVYHCDSFRSFLKDCKIQYDWLVCQMIKRIGDKPTGVEYPVWAWYQWEGERKKPDLRSERWGNGWDYTGRLNTGDVLGASNRSDTFCVYVHFCNPRTGLFGN